MPRSFRINPDSAAAQIVTNSAVRRTHPHKIDRSGLPSQDSLGGSDRILGQLKASGEIVSAASRKNAQEHIRAKRGIH